MEAASCNLSRGERKIHLSVPVCAAVSVMGAVTGTVIYSRSFSDADVQAFVEAQQALPREFGGYFTGTLVNELLFQAVFVILGMFVLGWLFALPLIFYGGLGVGVSVCCLCQHCGWFGALYSFAILAVPFLCFSVARCVLCGASMNLSYGMFAHAAGSRRPSRNHLLSMAIRIPLCGVIDIFAAALAAALRSVLHPIIV